MSLGSLFILLPHKYEMRWSEDAKDGFLRVFLLHEGADMTNDELKAAASTFGTPLYVFDERVLVKRVSHLRSLLPQDVKICYAVKANSFVLSALSDVVDSFEICSPGEVRICAREGLSLRRLIVSGVYKDEKTMGDLMASGKPIGRFTIESLSQLELLTKLARTNGVCLPVLLRLTSANQFGLDEEALTAAAFVVRRSPHLEFCGIQYFSGTQKTSLKRLGRELAYLDATIAQLEEKAEVKVKSLEYGPGLPVEYFSETYAKNERSYLEGFSKLLQEMRFDGEIVLEVGRSIAASCGTYLTRVVDTKRSGGKNYAIVDGGMHHIVYYGGAMAMKRPPCRVLGKNGAGDLWNVCGSLCTGSDILIKKLPIESLVAGDVIALGHAGAYCMIEGMSLFLSRDLPAVVAMGQDGQIRLLRPKTQVDGLNSPCA